MDFSEVVTEDCGAVLPYSRTFFPNPAFATVDDVKEIGDNLAFIKNCDPRALPFLCGMILPECPGDNPNGIGQGPCRKYCEEIANSVLCSQIFAFAGVDLGGYCDLLPTYEVPGNTDFCTFIELPPPPTMVPRKLKLVCI